LYDKAAARWFYYHGIRGLTASLLSAMGVPTKDLQFILLHASMMTTDKYIWRIGSAADVLAAALDSFDQKETASKVVPFKAAK